MRVTAREWIDNVRESKSISLGLNKRARETFSSKDAVSDVSSLPGDQIKAMFSRCIEQKLSGEDIIKKDIPLTYRNSADHGFTDAGHMTIVSKDWGNDTKSNIVVFGGQYDKILLMCICITEIEKASDTWHRAIHRDLIIPKGKKDLYNSDIFYGKDKSHEYDLSFRLCHDIDGRAETLGVKLDEDYAVGIIANGRFLLDDSSQFIEYCNDALDLYKKTLDARRAAIGRDSLLESKFDKVS